jgi:hypothetical protein
MPTYSSCAKKNTDQDFVQIWGTKGQSDAPGAKQGGGCSGKIRVRRHRMEGELRNQTSGLVSSGTLRCAFVLGPQKVLCSFANIQAGNSGKVLKQSPGEQVDRFMGNG